MTKIATGIPSEEIRKAAESEDSDLIVVGTRGKTGLAHVLLGSTAERLIRTAPCPVLAVRMEQSCEHRAVVLDRLLVPIDGSDCSLDALEYEPVHRWSSTVDAAEQPDTYSARTELSARLEQLLAKLPDDQRTALLLVDMQGFSYDEAAGIMAVAPGTIKSRISRARARLREEIRTDTDASELFDRFVRQESETST